MDGRIYYIKEMILGNIEHHWTLDMMAKEVNLSNSHLLRLFKSETGTTPITFIKKERLRQAKYLLENSFLQIQEIAFKVGVSDISQFTRDFKREYDLTPTEFRKTYWDKRKV